MNNNRGFTLIEIMVVIFIILILLTISIGGIHYVTRMNNERSTRTLVLKVEQAAAQYFNKYNVYPTEGVDFNKPTTESVVRALKRADMGHEFSGNDIKNNMFIDAWGRPLYYLNPGPGRGFKIPKVWSMGPNGKNDDGNYSAEKGMDDICNYQSVN